MAGGGGAVLPYMGYMGMCSPKGYGFFKTPAFTVVIWL